MCYDGKKRVKYFRLPNGREPFKDWFKKLDKKERIVIRGYVERITEGGGKKNIKYLGDGVFEIKIFFHSGLRVYFALENEYIILLLLGGNKTSQPRDIKLAKKYWRDYVSNYDL
jgi:putative addiction module killer protein